MVAESKGEGGGAGGAAEGGGKKAKKAKKARHVVVIGGGLVGASVAYYLRQLMRREKDLRITIVDHLGTAHPAVYRDDDGTSVLGEGTGATGDFAAFGIPGGPVEVRLFEPDGTAFSRSFVTRCEEDAVTSLFDFVVYDE